MRLRNGLLAVMVAAAFPASAAAAPTHTAVLNAGAPSFTWDGAGHGVSSPIGVVGVECGDAKTCQDILINVEETGDLVFDIQSADDQTVAEPTGEFGDIITMQDIDTYLYPSNAAGEVKGESLSEESATTKGDEKFTLAGVAPGFYLLQLEVFMGAEATWTGKVDLTNTVPKPAPVVEVPVEAPAPPATPAPASYQPAPPAQPYVADEPKPAAEKPSKKAACRKKARKIKSKGKRRKALKRCAKLR